MKDLWIFIVAVSALFIILSTFIITFTLIFLKRRKKHNDEKLALEVKFKETLLISQLEIREQTLKYISQELHDNLGQIASLIKINLSLISLEEQSKNNTKIEETKDLTRQLIADLKSLSSNLNGSLIAKIGLDKGIQNEVERLKRLGLFEISLLESDEFPVLNDQKSIILLRMVQEVLNNLLKHSKASNVKVAYSTNRATNILVLNIIDDGIGFELNNSLTKGGAGLYNLKERAELINAELLIDSVIEKGTNVTIKVPINK